MKRMKQIKRWCAVFLLILLLGLQVLPATAAISGGGQNTREAELPPLPEDSAGRDEITIANVNELLALAKACRLDTWSKDKAVRLTADISMAGIDFQGIPIFAGLFDGDGHTISGLRFRSAAVDCGFFGFVTETAQIRNLNLEGELRPNGIVSAAGAVACNNRGTIRNCSFSGTIDNATYERRVDADQATGGIAGVNEESGNILDCRVSGTVQGLKYTGGIVGINRGTVIGCSNDAAVNPDISDGRLKLDDLKIQGVSDAAALLSAKKMYAAENAGGIAGDSSGYLISCYNSGSVGTPENGYNVGGIAGRTGGYLSDCTNAGYIYGNSNVGGIAGQMEPSVRVNYTGDLLAGAREEVDQVFDLVDQTIGDMSGDVSDVSGELSNVMTQLDNTIRSVDAVKNDMAAFVDGVAYSANTYGSGINQLLDQIHVLTGGLQEMSGEAGQLSEHLGNGISNIKKVGTFAESGFSNLQKKVNQKEETVNIEGRIHWMNADNAELPSTLYLVAAGTDAVVYGVTATYPTVGSGSDWVYKIENLPKFDAKGNEIHYRVYEYMGDLFEGASQFLPVTDDYDIYNYCIDGLEVTQEGEVTGFIQWDDNLNANDERPGSEDAYFLGHYEFLGKRSTLMVHKETIYGQILDPTEPQWDFEQESLIDTMQFRYDGQPYNLSLDYSCALAPVKNYQTSALNNYGFHQKYVESQSTLVEIATSVLGGAAEVSGDVTAAIGDIKSATAYLTLMMEDMSEALAGMNRIGMPQTEPFPKLSPMISGSTAQMQQNISALTESLDRVNRALNNTQQGLTQNLQQINSQAGSMADSIFDVAYNFNFNLSNFIVDRSDASSDQEDLEIREKADDYGYLYGCSNTGEIRAAGNAGGIVGSISLNRMPVIRQGAKEEKALSLPTFSYRAVVDSCRSTANVTAEANNVGLICGTQGLGAILNCESSGNATSHKGQNVGGVAGFAHGLIRNCGTRCYLQGERYLGGIIGVGAEAEMVFPGSTVENCLAVTNAGDDAKYCGAIAGDYIGDFKDNKFYSENMEGIHAYNIQGEFEPVEEGALSKIEGFSADLTKEIPEEGLQQEDPQERTGKLRKILKIAAGGGGLLAVLAGALLLLKKTLHF